MIYVQKVKGQVTRLKTVACRCLWYHPHFIDIYQMARSYAADSY